MISFSHALPVLWILFGFKIYCKIFGNQPLNRPNLMREPRTYIVEMRAKVYQRIAEHIRLRSTRISIDEAVKDT